MTIVNGITHVCSNPASTLFCYNVYVFHALMKVTVLCRSSRFSIFILCIRTWRMHRRL